MVSVAQSSSAVRRVLIASPRLESRQPCAHDHDAPDGGFFQPLEALVDGAPEARGGPRGRYRAWRGR